MKRYIPLSLIGSAIVLCLAASTGQAAVPGVKSAVPAAAHASVVSRPAGTATIVIAGGAITIVTAVKFTHAISSD